MSGTLTPTVTNTGGIWFGFPPFTTTVSQNLYVSLLASMAKATNGTVAVTAQIAGESYNLATLSSGEGSTQTLYQASIPIGTNISTISVTVTVTSLGVTLDGTLPPGALPNVAAYVYEIYIQ